MFDDRNMQIIQRWSRTLKHLLSLVPKAHSGLVNKASRKPTPLKAAPEIKRKPRRRLPPSGSMLGRESAAAQPIFSTYRVRARAGIR